jgi:hypothetical protein
MLKASHHTSTLSASTFKKPSQSRKTARNLKKRIERTADPSWPQRPFRSESQKENWKNDSTSRLYMKISNTR